MNIKKHIPNTITCCNLLSGTLAVMAAYNGNYSFTVMFVMLSAVFDFFDGFTARLLKVSSPIGKELDSLADLVSFGFAPSMVAFKLLAQSEGVWQYTRFFALIMVAFSALRLAKFNLDERQSCSFIGLATPANAIFWTGLAYAYGNELALPSYPWAILIMVMISCYLLVCELPMFSLKFKTYGWKTNEFRWIFLAGAVVLLIILWTKALPAIIVFYILMSVCALFKKTSN